ncbi:MAG: ABC transporter permease subunit [Acidobacteria bacterium]|nr:ABC transporter permease subunit [Acidobacteriota bacterium]
MWGLLLALLMVAGGGRQLPTTSDLTWGGDAEGGAPYLLPDPQEPRRIIGFEVDLMKALAARLGRRQVFVQNQWDGLIPGLLRGNYDLAVNGLEITADRRQQIVFSIPYYACGEQLSVRRDDNSITRLPDLKGRVAGTLKFSLAQRLLEEAGGIEIRSYENQNNAYDDLAIGRIDAVLMDWPIAVHYSAPNPALKFAGPPIGLIEYGIGLRPADPALLQGVNDALLELMRSGELRQIYERWRIWNPETERLIARLAQDEPLGTPLNSDAVAPRRDLTLKERLARCVSYLSPMLLQGVPMTLLISLLGMALAMALGLVVALTNLYAARPLSLLARGYVELFRGTPLLIQLYLIYYGLPNIGIRLSPLAAAVLGLGLNYAACEAENYRAGILAIPRGQIEAALSLGLTRAGALRHVIVPQAIRLVIPPVTNDFIALFKDSSIVSVITMVELTKVYGQLAATYFDYIGAGLVAALLYLLLGLPFVRLARWAERRFRVEQFPH